MLHPLSAFALTACVVVQLAAGEPTIAPELLATMRTSDEWHLPEARDNGVRAEVVLNGFWLNQPEAEGAWRRVAIPAPGSAKAKQRFYREFTVPETWRDRRLTIEVSHVSGTVTVNDVLVGEPRGKRFYEYDLTAASAADGRYRVEIIANSMQGDVWLRAYPRSGTTITESYARTSWRDQMLRLDLAGTAAPGATVQVVASVSEQPAEAAVITLPSATVTAAADGTWKTTVSAPWGAVKAWTHRRPHLYHYVAEVQDRTGARHDALLPRRFGFREVWVENGTFMLNGMPVSIVDDVWEGGVDQGNTCRAQAEIAIDRVKELGFTGAIRLSSEVALQVADEKGLLVSLGAGSMVRFNIWDPKSGLTRMDGDENRDDIERLVRRLREHPSILIWFSPAPYSLASMHPQYAGQYFNTWDFFPLNRFSDTGRQGQLIFKEAVDLIRTIDPERIVANHNGPFSPVEVATRYLCDDLDLQEREEFFDHWFRSGPERKAIWVNEFGTPFASHQFLRRIDHQMPQGPAHPKIHLENLARQIGQEAYRREDDANFPQWLRDDFYVTMRYPAMQELTAANVTRYWRAWRTYGISASAHHVLGENAMGPVAKDKASAQVRYGFSRIDDPRVPGYSQVVRAAGVPALGIDEVPPAAQAYLDVVRPVLGYIGGPDTYFTNKDHLYFAGAPVRKAYVVLNDLDVPVTIDGTWTLRDAAGTAVVSGALRGEVAPGRRELTGLPIEFPAPAVSERTDFTIEVAMPERADATLTDRFAITVFPEHVAAPPAFTGTVWTLTISDDLTHESPHFFINRDNLALLAAAGIEAKLVQGSRTFTYKGYSPTAAMDYFKERERVTDGMPAAGDVLIIPRHLLSAGTDHRQTALRTLERIGFDALVEQGLRVLILEQDEENLLGLNTEHTRPRQAFISAVGHPVFAGLADSDLTNWTGASNLNGAMTALAPTDQRFPERMWHVSHTNAVATRTLIRPQVGAVRALAVSGFDLQESPLLEVVRGKGRILFCQFDVTNRYGIDPAATRLFDNILRYLASAPDADPAKGDLLIADREAEGVAVTERVYRAAVPTGSDGWGITQGELFVRESLYVRNAPTRTLPDLPLPVFAAEVAPAGNAYPQIVRRVGDRLQIAWHPDLFSTGWMQRKMRWVHAALIVNQGGSRMDGPALRHHGRLTDLYPVEWVEDFVHPYTTNIW